MRKLVASLFMSLNGVVEAPDQWQFDVFDDAMMAEMMAQIAQIDTILLGRVTYEEWAGYWPTAEEDQSYATFINNTPKLVVSSTLKTVAWGDKGHIELLEGDLSQAIAQLKAQPGKHIGVNGSPSLVASLLQHDLLDVLHIQVHPVVIRWWSGRENGFSLRQVR